MGRGEHGLLFTLESIRKVAEGKVIGADDFDVGTIDGVVALGSTDLGRTDRSAHALEIISSCAWDRSTRTYPRTRYPAFTSWSTMWAPRKPLIPVT